MKFPIIKQEDETLALEVPDEVLQQLTSLLSSPAEPTAELKESQDKVVKLEERVTAAEGRTMDDFTPVQKADFVIAWGKGLSPEDKAIFAGAVGIPNSVKAATVAESDEDPGTIQGKTDKPGYKYLEHLNMSVKEESKEA